MNRRDFLNTAAVAGAVAGFAGATASAAPAEKSAPAARRPLLDPNDRSTGRDPLQVQRATLVVEGVANGRGEDYLKL
jgi:hypothetical protein